MDYIDILGTHEDAYRWATKVVYHSHPRALSEEKVYIPRGAKISYSPGETFGVYLNSSASALVRNTPELQEHVGPVIQSLDGSKPPADRDILITAQADGVAIGGMTYRLSRDHPSHLRTTSGRPRYSRGALDAERWACCGCV